MRIGVDAGGTFTDFIVLHDDGRLESFKIRSNPKAPHIVILEGLLRAAGKKKADVVHGSTVATNALLERKGVKTAFVTTAGFEDLIRIGRQNRRELYNLTPVPTEPLVECFGVDERTYFDGTVAVDAQTEGLADTLRKAGIEAVAICFLHSYQNAANEKKAVQALEGFAYVCASHEISPEFREYERASTTVINAYIGPLMDRYLGALEAGTKQKISILQSNGGFMTAPQARRHAVRTVLSGPAGGAIGAVEMARKSGFRQIIGFDMGGTSTDVSLCDGAPTETMDSTVDGFPVRIPMLEIHTVGAGGGSIARVDAGGLLRVGPESAGADPGPACYGTGERATVTDAQVVLGRIAPAQFLGGEMKIDASRSRAAIDRIAHSLSMDTTSAAEGILRVANANMERAIRTVSIERGYDPREFALVAFGGGGGLHACEIAAQLQIATVIVPRYAEGLSALGMLLADQVRDYAAGVLGRQDVEERFTELERTARKENRGAELERTADLRYQGQSYELNVPWTNAEKAFHAAHQKNYGYARPGHGVEVVTIRVRARKATEKPTFPPMVRLEGAHQHREVFVDGRWRKIPLLHREQLSKTPQSGPALILDYGSTTLITAGWSYHLDRTGNLIATRA